MVPQPEVSDSVSTVGVDMRIRGLAVSILALSCMITWGCRSPADDDAVSVNRLSDRLMLVQSGESYDDTVIAVAGERGILVIDTGIAPTWSERYRAAIEDEFGREDFAYVINTHSHFDHTDGNQVFSDSVIIGHDLCREQMIRFGSGVDAFLDRQRTRVEGWRQQLEGLDPDTEDAARLRDLVASYGLMCDDLEENYVLTPPTVTFSDRMTLDLGDLTAHLYYWGQGTHTGDDIVVHVPEEGLVATGDLMYPGGIQFAVDPDVDVPRQLDVLDAVLTDDGAVRHVVTVHNGIMTPQDLEIRRDYMASLWKTLREASEHGQSLAGVRHLVSLDVFEEISQLDIDRDTLENQHQGNVNTLWMHLVAGQSAAQVLEKVLDEEDLEAAAATFREMLPQRGEKFFFDENQINALGYRLMGQDRLDEAIAVFRMNVELFPDAWNVYDSLGEAYMVSRERDLAIASYQRSLELNPDNANGVAMLERLRPSQ
jgi:glyoxylase-like metal-dependent hydrolase (beta-lactamase superfamily II)